MSNILQFPARAERLPKAAPQASADVRPMRDVRPMAAPANEAPVVQSEGVSAVGILKTLAFYAGQGFDHGQRAREALDQMHAHINASHHQGEDRA